MSAVRGKHELDKKQSVKKNTEVMFGKFTMKTKKNSSL